MPHAQKHSGTRPDTPAARALPADPWEAPDDDAPSDSGGWLLGYSDLMTLLFTCFVMLFAYQKILGVKIEPTARQAPAALAAAPARPAASPPAASPPAAKPPTVKPPTPVTSPAPDNPPVATAATPPPPRTAATQERPAAPAPLAAALPQLPGRAAAAPPAAALPEPPAWVSLAPMPSGFGDTVEVSQAPGQVRMEIGGNLLFDPARAELKPEGLAVLDRVAQWLSHQAGTIVVEGHTDDRPLGGGRYLSNFELSAARAGTVTRCLAERGIAPERLRAVGLADTQPRADNTTPEGRAKNRRVSLIVYLERGAELRI